MLVALFVALGVLSVAVMLRTLTRQRQWRRWSDHLDSGKANWYDYHAGPTRWKP